MKRVTDRTRDLVEAYLQVAARSGSTFSADGIRLSDGMYLQPDKAVMNAALEHGWVELDDETHVFRATAHGWEEARAV